MPTYVYRREDGTTFEIKQRITEDPLQTCPETGQEVERIITGNAGLIFKGDGFYVNDYGNGNGAGKTSPSDSSETTPSEETPSSSKSESEGSADTTTDTEADVSSN